MQEAMFYVKSINRQVRCDLCPHHCIIDEDKSGLCRVRKNIKGQLYSLNYGHLSAIAIDPIEKKPLNHFMPGSHILSVGSFGCNMKCPFCQNWDISQEFIMSASFTQAIDIIDRVFENKLTSIAYTYNEPTVFYEWMYDTMVLAKQYNLKNVMVTNGFIERDPFNQLLPYIDAMNIDVKTYDDHKYQSIYGGRLKPVLNTIKRAVNHGVHVELTCLIVPGLNDELEALDRFFKYLFETAGNLCIHLSRYFPRYYYDAPATNIQQLLEIKKMAQKYFEHVYLGNVR